VYPGNNLAGRRKKEIEKKKRRIHVDRNNKSLIMEFQRNNRRRIKEGVK
jgi:hypothetical protein